ncbi:MAG TPA: anti-sigma factor [Calditrichia bacterium]|nr:anti-sigma factor [Calditrichia bacterium]
MSIAPDDKVREVTGSNFGNGLMVESEIIFELSAAYHLGILDAASRQEYESMLSDDHPELMEVHYKYQELTGLLAYAAAPQAPPQGIKDQIFEQLRALSNPPEETLTASLPEEAMVASQAPLAEENPAPRKTPPAKAVAKGGWPASAITLCLLLLLGVAGAGYYIFQLRQTVSDVSNQMSISQQLVDSQQRKIRHYETLNRLFGVGEVQMSAMEGRDNSATGLVAFSAVEQQAILMVHNLPEIPVGQVARVWCMRNGVFRPLGVLGDMALGNALITLDLPNEAGPVTAFLVAAESPVAGDSPGGDLLLSGTVQGAGK